MTLQELADGWNLLRNAALGRGVQPLVSAELAELVGHEYERFRAWLAEQGPMGEVVPEVTARPWLTLQRQLAARVRGEGRWAPDVAETALERAGDTAAAIGRGALWLVLGAAGLGVVWMVASKGAR